MQQTAMSDPEPQPGAWASRPDVHRELRGHSFRPAPETLAAIPPLHTNETTPMADVMIYLRFTLPEADSEWFVAELDTDGIAYGWARLAHDSGAWGMISLRELEEINLRGVVVRRDTEFTPTRAAECLPPRALG